MSLPAHRHAQRVPGTAKSRRFRARIEGKAGAFTTLAAVDPMTSAPRRRLWVYLAVLAGAGVVALSWTVPEPPAPASPAQSYEHVSYSSCLPDSAPSYGTRSISYSCTN